MEKADFAKSKLRLEDESEVEVDDEVSILNFW